MSKPTFLENEDWIALIAGFLLILGSIAGFTFGLPKLNWANSSELITLLQLSNLLSIFGLYFIILAIGLLSLLSGKRNFLNLVTGIFLIFTISIIAQLVSGYKPVKDLGLEYVIFALLLGIIMRSLVGVPGWLKDAVQSEFFIKTGLVLLGTGIIFGEIIKAGALGLIQALVVVLSVWYFAFWLAKKFKVDEELSLMISSAVSICGVSAAIATCGAIQGDNKKLSYVVSLVLIVALPMMIFLPIIANALDLNAATAGAWMGGTIDTTGAVVASGAILGEEALKFSTIVKFSQNVLLGFAAILISIFWTVRGKQKDQSKSEKVDWGLIWERFPKFVIGFLVASLLYSFVVPAETVVATKEFLKGIQTALFAFAFVSIGLETDLSVLVKTGNGKPALVFIVAQIFNVLITLVIAYLLFR
jgi:uncharacterized integral membrane protein (TIGR00698 family)